MTALLLVLSEEKRKMGIKRQRHEEGIEKGDGVRVK